MSFFSMLHRRNIFRAAIDFAVACGRVDGFYEIGLRPRDVAASALILGMALMLFAPRAAATQVQVIECGVFLPQKPLPSEYLELYFTIRRHVEHTEPVSLLQTEIWSQAKYEDNGYFEVTVYPLEGEPRVERSTSTLTTILDGNEIIGDEYGDQALTMEKTIEYEGYTLDSIGIALKKSDGTAISDTRILTELDLSRWDPQVCDSGEGGSGRCDTQCYVRWLAPPPGVICGTDTGATLCKTGTYLGAITSVSYEPHEEDHGGGFSINSGLNDAWASADAPLQGFFFTVFPDLGFFFLSWFTFDSEPPAGGDAVFGAIDQRWVTGGGAYSGDTATISVELTTGGVFNATDPTATQTPGYGTITIVFNNCNEAVMTYDFPSLGLSDQMTLSRVLSDNVSLCEAMSTQ